jgi:hypothetical protein
MSLPDATFAAQLDEAVIKPVFFIWLDIDGDPVRVNTSGRNITPSGTGDVDLDGLAFDGIGGGLLDVSSVRFKEGGSESVTVTLSGIAGLDDDTLTQIENAANWRGREARLWRIVRNAANVQQGGYHAYYTGRIISLRHSGSVRGQVLTLTVESYLAMLSEASNRTYLDQERYDAGDLSAQATIAVANGNYTGASTTAASTVDDTANGKKKKGKKK